MLFVSKKSIVGFLLLGLVTTSGQSATLGKRKTRDDKEVVKSKKKKKQKTEKAQQQKTHDQKRLASNGQKFGNKTANLLELEIFAKNYNNAEPSYTISIPSFIGISHEQVQTFLEKNGLNLAVEWKKIVGESFTESKEEKDAIYSSKLPDAFSQKITVLAERVEKFFASSSDASLFDGDAKQFIAKTAEAKKVLMVRSTGKEDSEECSNAGGNESKANIAPEEKALLVAIGQVVASYLKPKSLQQRIDAKDATVLDAPFTPVLLQVMIGEPQDGYEVKDLKSIQRCGVMYTQEQQGNTSGVTHIEVTYGNNEAVVNPVHQNKVSYDTFYVDKSGVIHASIKQKVNRLVPTAHGLGYKKNPKSLRRKPALSSASVEQLAQVARALQAFYGVPQDVEFLVDETKKIIYLVQSRPNQKQRFISKPQYITSLDKFEKEQIVKGSTVILGDASVGIITSSDQVIVASTLSEALEATKTKKAQYAFIQQPAGQLSHEAAILSGMNIKTLLISDMTGINKWLEEKEPKLVVDFQRSVVVNAATQLSDVKVAADLVKNKFVTENWLNHPIKTSMSMLAWNGQKAYRGLLDQVLEKFPISGRDYSLDPDIKYTQMQEDLSLEKLPFLTPDKVKEYFETLKECDAKTAEKTLVHLLRHAYASIYEQRQLLYKKEEKVLSAQLLSPARAQHLQQLNGLFQYMLAAANEVLFAFGKKELPARSMERLYPITQLEKLFLQEAAASTMYAASLATLQAQHEEYKTFVEKILQPLVETKQVDTKFVRNEHYMAWAQEGVACAMTPELEKSWVVFLEQLRLHLNPDQQKQFAELMHYFNRLDIMPSWINTIFASQKISDEKSARACFENMQKDFVSSKDLLKEMATKKRELETIKANLIVWEDPKQVEVQWPLFKDGLVTYFTTGLFGDFKQFEALSPFAKNTALSVMKTMVDTFDSMIKTMKGSTQFAVMQKVEMFKTMLQSYAAVLEAWIKIIDFTKINMSPDEGSMDPADMEFHHKYWEISKTTPCLNLNYCLTVIRTCAFYKHSYEHLLMPSKNFDAFAITSAAFANDANIRRNLNYCSSCEDAFTLIHQLLLKTISILFTTNDNVGWVRPPLLETLEKCIRQVKSDYTWKAKQNPSFIGSSFRKGFVTLSYTLGLQQHGIMFDLDYNKQSNTVDLSLKFFGNEPWRWKDLRDLALFFSHFEKYKLTHLAYSDTGVACTFTILSSHAPESIATMIEKMIYQTCGRLRQPVANPIVYTCKQAKRMSDCVLFTQSLQNCKDSSLRDLYQSLVMRMFDTGYDFPNIEQIAQDACMSEKSSTREFGTKMLCTLIEEKKCLVEAKKLALTLCKNEDNEDDLEVSFKLLEALVENNSIASDEAISIAQAACAHEKNNTFVVKGLGLLTTLVETKKITDWSTITGALENVYKNSNQDVIERTCEFVKKIIKQGFPVNQNIHFITTIAQTTCMQDKSWIISKGFDLLKLLIKHDSNNFEVAFSVIKDAYMITDSIMDRSETRAAGIEFLQEFIQQNCGIKQAIVLIQTACKDRTVDEPILSLCNTLLEQSKNDQTILNLAHEAVKIAYEKNPKMTFRRSDMENLYISLVRNGLAINEALGIVANEMQCDLIIALFEALRKSGDIQRCIRLAQITCNNSQQGWNSGNKARQAGLDIFKFLFEKNTGFKEAFAAITKHNDGELREIFNNHLQVLVKNKDEKAIGKIIAAVEVASPKTRLELFPSLVKQNHGISEAVRTIITILEGKEAFSSNSYAVLNLLTELVGKNPVHDQVYSLAKKAIRIALDNNKLSEVLYLVSALVEKEQAYDLAIELIKLSIKNNDFPYEILDLLQSLVEKEKGQSYGIACEVIKMQSYGIACEVIKIKIQNKKVTFQDSMLLKKLVKNGFVAAYELVLPTVEASLALQPSAESRKFWAEKNLLETVITKLQGSQNPEEAELLAKAKSLLESIAGRK